MKVICVNPPDLKECLERGIKPLEMLETYTVSRVVEQPKGTGYLLEEVSNRDIIVVDKNGDVIPGEEVSYLSTRFMRVSSTEDVIKEITAIGFAK